MFQRQILLYFSWSRPGETEAPLTAIDPKTNTVVRQWVGAGGDSLHTGFGAIWLTNYDAGALARIPLAATGVTSGR